MNYKLAFLFVLVTALMLYGCVNITLPGGNETNQNGNQKINNASNVNGGNSQTNYADSDFPPPLPEEDSDASPQGRSNDDGPPPLPR